MSKDYIVGSSELAKMRFKIAKKNEEKGLKPTLKPPFVNLPETEITDIYKQNIILDNKNINNIKYMALKKHSMLGKHWHKHTYHYILLMKGSLAYYEKPVENAKGVYLNKINFGEMFYIPPMSEYQIIAEVDEAQFYVFTNKSNKEEALDTFISNYDIKNFPLISRPDKPGPIEYIKRFSYENN